VWGRLLPSLTFLVYHAERKKAMKKIIPFQAIALAGLALNKSETAIYYIAILLLSLSLLLNAFHYLKESKDGR
jgi:hypothetical protein